MIKTVVAAVIERADRRLLIGQRRSTDSSPLKWEFPGGKVKKGEALEVALARELREELGATLRKSVEIARVRHAYAATANELEIRFFAAEIVSDDGSAIDMAADDSAIDPEQAALSPGLICVAEGIRIAIDEGCQVADFLRGSEAYKYHLGAKDEPLWRLHLTVAEGKEGSS